MKKAHEDFEKCIKIKPKLKVGYLYNGVACRNNNEFDKALDMFNTLIALYPDYSQGYAQRAIVWYKIGNNERACNDVERAISLGEPKAAELKKEICK